MKTPDIPANEAERLKVLREYNILDTMPEAEYDEITLIASQICQAPISLISLIDDDRQWFKSRRGLDVQETPRDYAFCAHAINTPSEVLTVPDSRVDQRFQDNPLVIGDPHVIFYAGVPLVTPEGHALGTICVIDHTPHTLTPDQILALRALSRHVMKLLEVRRMNQVLGEHRDALAAKNEALRRFAYVVSHDIKSPLNNILSITDILRSDHADSLNDDGRGMLEYLTTSSEQLKQLVDGILAYYASDVFTSQERTPVSLLDAVQTSAALLDPKGEHDIRYSGEPVVITTAESAVRQVLLNLLSNGIKYNRSARVQIKVSALRNPDSVTIRVEDNGIGIPEMMRSKIFEPFTTLGEKDRFDRTGTGIGLSTVKKIIEQLDGTIRVDSAPGGGTVFIIDIKD